jgi:hypothetical protein
MIIEDRIAIAGNQLPQEFADVYVPAVPALHRAILDQIVLSPEDMAIVRYRLAKIHLAAIICQYGEPPKEIGFFKEPGVVDGVEEIRILVRYVYPQLSHAAYNWLEAVAAGLSTWGEAGFEDPITVRWVDGKPADLMINEPEDFLVHQFNRFRLEYDEKRLTRLMSYMSLVMNRV